jgi:catechol 2,3-dioxygenase-like lactoylglutathione lyase family enzyme
MTDSHTDNRQFLELGMPVSDTRRSLEWYRSLGFIELVTNDIRPYHYAVISDGDFCIGLHGENLTGPALTFVQPDLARHVRARMGAGEEFDLTVLGIDDFHETMQTDPDGSHAIMLEARTFSPSHDSEALPLSGRLDRIVLPCMRIEESLEFWQRYGFIAVEMEDSNHIELHAPGLVIELQAGTRNLTLRFQPEDYDAAVATLNQTHELKMFTERDVKGVELTAPEDTRIQLLNNQLGAS